MGNPFFLFADRFSGAVVHLTTGSGLCLPLPLLLLQHLAGLPDLPANKRSHWQALPGV
jgi:hypothetical protein